MFRSIYIHKKNNVSFSYRSDSLNKYNFNKYNIGNFDNDMKYNDTFSLVQHVYQPMTLNNQYHNINTIKDGIYKIDDTLVHTRINVNELYHLNDKSSNLYSFVMKLIHIDTIDFAGRMKHVFQKPISFVCSSFRVEDVLDINMNDYYEVYIKNKRNPIYLQEEAIIYDETGFGKKILDIAYKMGRRRVLGIDDLHNVREYEIERVLMKNPVDEMKNDFDVQFLEIGIQDNTNQPIIMDNIIVSLD